MQFIGPFTLTETVKGEQPPPHNSQIGRAKLPHKRTLTSTRTKNPAYSAEHPAEERQIAKPRVYNECREKRQIKKKKLYTAYS